MAKSVDGDFVAVDLYHTKDNRISGSNSSLDDGEDINFGLNVAKEVLEEECRNRFSVCKVWIL